MNIGIFVYSKTGHTLSVAEKLQDTLLQKGHKVVLQSVRAGNEGEMETEKIVLSNQPSTEGFDLLVFAGPVNGGRLAIVMEAFLQRLPPMDGKLLAGFVTQAFPFPSLGGNQAIAGMERLLQAKGGRLSATGIVNWMFPGKRNALIAQTIEKIAALCS